jgi:hypothetical protein
MATAGRHGVIEVADAGAELFPPHRLGFVHHAPGGPGDLVAGIRLRRDAE